MACNKIQYDEIGAKIALSKAMNRKQKNKNRLDGPAIEWADGNKFYYKNGQEIKHD